MYFVALESLHVRVSADIRLVSDYYSRGKWVVSNAQIRAGWDSVLILSKSYGTRVTLS
jgi:hypothetical protein